MTAPVGRASAREETRVIRRILGPVMLAALIGASPAFADTFRVMGGFGNDGCAVNPGFDVSGGAAVQASSGLVNCFSGVAAIAAVAGPGFLGASADATHTGFGTGTSGGSQAELHGAFTLVSAVNMDVPISLNLLVTGDLTDVSGPNGWTVRLIAGVDGIAFAGGSWSQIGSAGLLIPFPDGATHLFTTPVVMVSTNTPHVLDLLLSTGVGASQFGAHIALDYLNSATFPTSGLVFNVPEGVSVTDTAGLSVFDNHWTDPRPVPEPSSLLLLGTGVASLTARRLKRRSVRAS